MSYVIDYGDGTIVPLSGYDIPDHIYPIAGTYTVTLSETDSGRSYSLEIEVYQESVVHGRSALRRYPTGRSWRGELPKALCDAVGRELEETKLALRTLASVQTILFSAENMAEWEYILGLSGTGTTQERQDAILSKMGNESQVIYDELGSLSKQYIEKVLRDNGFDVYVHSNGSGSNVLQKTTTMGDGSNFGGPYGTPIGGIAYDPPFSRFSDVSLGIPNNPTLYSGELCINFIDASKDAGYSARFTNDSRRWRYLFYIGGATLGDYANIPLVRKEEFRKLVLQLKAMGDWAMLLVNYI